MLYIRNNIPHTSERLEFYDNLRVRDIDVGSLTKDDLDSLDVFGDVFNGSKYKHRLISLLLDNAKDRFNNNVLVKNPIHIRYNELNTFKVSDYILALKLQIANLVISQYLAHNEDLEDCTVLSTIKIRLNGVVIEPTKSIISKKTIEVVMSHMTKPIDWEIYQELYSYNDKNRDFLVVVPNKRNGYHLQVIPILKHSSIVSINRKDYKMEVSDRVPNNINKHDVNLTRSYHASRFLKLNQEIKEIYVEAVELLLKQEALDHGIVEEVDELINKIPISKSTESFKELIDVSTTGLSELLEPLKGISIDNYFDRLFMVCTNDIKGEKYVKVYRELLSSIPPMDDDNKRLLLPNSIRVSNHFGSIYYNSHILNRYVSRNNNFTDIEYKIHLLMNKLVNIIHNNYHIILSRIERVTDENERGN